MFSSLLMLLTLHAPTAEAGGADFLQNLGSAFGGAGGEVKSRCKDPVAEVESWIASNGAISGDNIKMFTDLSAGPRPQPDDALRSCLAVQTKPDSGPAATQRDMAMKLLDMTIAKHLVIDDVGDGRSYYGPGQGFYNAKPFESNHNACNEMDPKANEASYKETYLLLKLNGGLENAGAHPSVSAAIQAKIDEFIAIGKKKSDACLATKLDAIKPYGNYAPTAVRTKWEETARVHFAKFTDKSILRVVFPEAQWRRTKKQQWDEYNKTWTPIDFQAMDIIVYADNGEFVDGYAMAVVYDHIQGTEYVTFPYAEGVGSLPKEPYQRVMKKNF